MDILDVKVQVMVLLTALWVHYESFTDIICEVFVLQLKKVKIYCKLGLLLGLYDVTSGHNSFVLAVDVVGGVWGRQLASCSFFIVQIFTKSFKLFYLFWEGCCRLSVDDVILVVEDLNVVFSCDNITLVNIYQIALLICRKNNLVINIEVSFILDNVLDVSGSLHIVLTSISVDTDMTHLLVCSLEVVFLSYIIVVLIIVVDIWVGVVLMSLCKLEDDLILLSSVFVVRVDQHKLIVI